MRNSVIVKPSKKLVIEIVNPSAKKLVEAFRIYCKDAKYCHTGNWFHCLMAWPGILMDANGFVMFDSEKEYRNCKYLQINDETNIVRVTLVKSIAEIFGYTRYNDL